MKYFSSWVDIDVDDMDSGVWICEIGVTLCGGVRGVERVRLLEEVDGK